MKWDKDDAKWDKDEGFDGMSAQQKRQAIEDMYAIQRAENEEGEQQNISRKMLSVLTEGERAKRKGYNDARRGKKVRGGKKKQMM